MSLAKLGASRANAGLLDMREYDLPAEISIPGWSTERTATLCKLHTRYYNIARNIVRKPIPTEQNVSALMLSKMNLRLADRWTI